MESKYKEILLLTGLDNITDEELDRFKFFLPDELKVSTAKLENANRTEVANLMIQNVGAVSAVTKTIHVFQKLNYMHVAKSLQEEKEKVDKKYKGKKGTQQVKKRSQTEMSPGASAAPRNSVVEQHIAPEVSPHVKPKQKQMVAKQEPIRKEGLQKGSMTVMVLKATKPFEFETKEGKQEMFHATVATESEFFFVKVFNKKLKDKFTPKNIIIISKYYWHSHFLEVNSVSRVSDAKSDQQISVPKHIIRKAGETPKINKLQTQPHGTIVNGVFVIQKKTERRNHQLFDLSDSTGRMEVLVLGKQNKIECEEGDKLRLTFFELSRTGEKLQLKSGIHSLVKVGTTRRKSKCPRG
uniref:Interferon-inducible protein AIM2 n=1 Tax=Equus caballus TaxID=9796 RepID=A0A3Q2I5M2_HORSE|nr:interferon-inducible protein AIM2 isoform X1 [Equus caballus]XP_023496689.1 interferon-inducible protein AIM2 isoform X1 [Equus caballus]XP_023496690.1 interferon-inducible protein AIM2 isoform X1 [Equus caballus]XP_023496691.1 interferon-inducible protein AIM2 isoform X1 [Equus caballus]XP_023496693.1 interferon-inducible protein AIM2 isoform X1 [Equus caballus]